MIDELIRPGAIVPVDMKTTASLVQHIMQLREALAECAGALAEEVEGHYRETKDHPAMKRRYDRDMAPALAAYKLLGIDKALSVV